MKHTKEEYLTAASCLDAEVIDEMGIVEAFREFGFDCSKRSLTVKLFADACQLCPGSDYDDAALIAVQLGCEKAGL